MKNTLIRRDNETKAITLFFLDWKSEWSLIRSGARIL